MYSFKEEFKCLIMVSKHEKAMHLEGESPKLLLVTGILL